MNESTTVSPADALAKTAANIRECITAIQNTLGRVGAKVPQSALLKLVEAHELLTRVDRQTWNRVVSASPGTAREGQPAAQPQGPESPQKSGGRS